MRSLPRVSAALCLGAVLTACGSTVPVSQQAGGGSTTGGLDGLSSTTGDVSGGAAGSTSGGTTGTSGGFGSGTTGAGSTGASGSGSSATGGSGTTGAGTGAASSTGLGVVSSTKPIEIAITFVKDAAAGAQALGIQGATLGDQQRYAQILVDDANKRGGLGGRKIVPVFFGYDVNPGSATYAQQDSVACARFLQDHKVEIAIANFAGEGLWECMRKKNVPMILDGPTGGVGNGAFRKYPQLVVLGGFNLHRRAAEEVKTLVWQKYFSGWNTTDGGPGVAPVKVGILTYDLPDWTSSANVLATSVQAAGYGKPVVVAVAAHDSYGNLSKMQGQVQNAQLQFRTAGVTHVIIWDDNGVSTLFFMQNAENQRYRPRYGITSGNNMRLLSSGLVADEQLIGATGMGFVPAFDLDDAQSPTSKYANSARKACYALMKKNEATGSGFNETSAMMYCSVMTAIKERWEAMKAPSAAGLIASIEQYGSSFVDPQVPSVYLSPTRHDGLGGYYDYSYDGGCGCMKYGPTVHPLAKG